MNKQAYFKLMGLQKKADLVDWIKNKYKDLQADQQIRDIKASAERERKRSQEAQKAEIAKGVTAAENKYKQERKQDAKTVAKIKADRKAREQRAADIARSNRIKAAQEEVVNDALTPAQRMQKRILQQKARNAQNRALNAFSAAKKNISSPLDNALAFSKGTEEYNTKKQLEQALAPKGDPMKLIRSGVTNQFLNKAKKNISSPLDEAIKGNNSVANILNDPLSLAGDADKIRSRFGHQMIQQKIDQLAAKNKEMAAKLGIPQGADPAAFGNKMLDAQGQSAKNFYNMFYPKNSIEPRMKQLNRESADALEADAVRKGLGNVFMFDRFNKGNMSDAAKTALGQNIRKYTTYKDKGWWERLLAWLRQMWAGISGGNPLATERGAALQAGERAGNIWAGLSDKIQKGLLQGK